MGTNQPKPSVGQLLVTLGAAMTWLFLLGCVLAVLGFLFYVVNS